ncbi:MAG: histidinol dehydrogenase, partial [Candidatus Geothermincolia bacterium]
MIINTYEIKTAQDVGSTAERIRARASGAGDVAADVSRIISEVRSKGDEALVELTARYDGVKLDVDFIEVPSREMEQALASLGTKELGALERARDRIKRFAERSMPKDWSFEQAPGLTVGQVRRPLDTVGVYVPGGR